MIIQYCYGVHTCTQKSRFFIATFSWFGFHWLILCLEYPPVYRTSLQKVLTKKSMVTLVTEELKQTVVIYETVEANCIKGTRCDWLNATVEWR